MSWKYLSSWDGWLSNWSLIYKTHFVSIFNLRRDQSREPQSSVSHSTFMEVLWKSRHDVIALHACEGGFAAKDTIMNFNRASLSCEKLISLSHLFHCSYFHYQYSYTSHEKLLYFTQLEPAHGLFIFTGHFSSVVSDHAKDVTCPSKYNPCSSCRLGDTQGAPSWGCIVCMTWQGIIPGTPNLSADTLPLG